RRHARGSWMEARRLKPKLLSLEDRCLPSGVPATWSQRGAGGGGSLFSPSINPANLSEYYVSSDMSQLFHSGDAGGTWQTTDFRKLQGNHESRVGFTNDANLRYALDYSPVGGVDETRPSKTSNAGATWTPLAS